MDEYNDFEYDDFALLQEEYKYEGSKRTSQQYYQISLSGGLPVFSAASLKENEKYVGPEEKIYPNLTGSIQFPYFQLGAVDTSPGFRLMNYGFENSTNGQWEMSSSGCVQASFDFKPVFTFFPTIFTYAEFGLSYNIAFGILIKIQYQVILAETVQPAKPGQKYGGLGLTLVALLIIG